LTHSGHWWGEAPLQKSKLLQQASKLRRFYREGFAAIMKRNGMDFALFWLVIIGPILISLAGCIWYGDGRTPALWVAFAGAVLLMLAAALQLQQAIWKSQAPEPTASNTAAKQMRPSLPPMPSLLSLFMTDFMNKGSGGGITLLGNAYAELTFSGDTNLRILYNIVQDFGSRSKFIIFYIPSSQHTYDAIEFLADGYKQYINTTMPYSESGGEGVQSFTKSSELIFTGRIFIYYENPLTVAQLGKLAELYNQHGVSPEFRSTQYALAVWNSIRSGDAKAPPQYELHDNLPRLTPEQETAPTKSAK
jgi:hypothetical protein